MLHPPYAVSVLGLFFACFASCSLPADPDPATDSRAVSGSIAGVQRDARTGLVTELQGDFPADPGAPAAAAEAFLIRRPDLFGVRSSDLELTSERTSLVGTHVRFRQLVQGRPLFGAEAAVHLRVGAGGNRVFLVRSSLQPAPRVQAVPMPREAAVERARTAAVLPGAQVDEASEVVLRDGRYGWQIDLRQDAPARLVRVIVASDGAVAASHDLLKNADGTGWVFDPNPVAATGDFTLADNANADSPVLTAQRIQVTLQGLDGTGKLSGPYVNAYNSANVRASEPGLVFDYTRSNDFFEEVMAYFHIDRARRRLATMGFTVMNWPINVQVNGKTQDNSWYDTKKKTIMFGSGGVDDAEDADVILHEYAHAVIADQVPGFGMYYPGAAIDEGQADFFAAASHAQTSPYLADKACLAPWDATSYSPPPCLRRTDTNKHNPELAEYDIHTDGEMWSAAMWEAGQTIGVLEMLRIQEQSHFLLSASPTFQQAADSIVLTDQQIAGGAHAELLRRVLTWRGLSATLTAPSTYAGPWESRPIAVSSQTPYPNRHDKWVDISHPGATAIRVHFSAFSTEAGHDHVYLYDPDVHLYAILDGSLGPFDSVAIPGDSVRVRLVSDAATTAAGFSIDHYDVPTQPDAGEDGATDAAEEQALWVDASEEAAADVTQEPGQDAVQEAAADAVLEAAADAVQEPGEDAALDAAEDAMQSVDAADDAPSMQDAGHEAGKHDASNEGGHEGGHDAADAAKQDSAPAHDSADEQMADAPVQPGTSDAQDAGGCGCRVPASSSSSAGWVALVALGAALRRRRARKAGKISHS